MLLRRLAFGYLLLVSACGAETSNTPSGGSASGGQAGQSAGGAGGAGSGGEGAVGGSSAKLSCDVPVYQLARGDVVDHDAQLDAGVCEDDDDGIGQTARVDVFGGTLCPGHTEHAPQYPPECLDDSGCDSGERCLCSLGYESNAFPVDVNLSYPNTCIPAECGGPEDCNGRACSLAFDNFGVAKGLFCRTANDECQDGKDCDPFFRCSYDTDRWVCQGAYAG
ncbi:MAG: hypothetical protein AB7S68_21225 [Polyangiaceae bacterium]